MKTRSRWKPPPPGRTALTEGSAGSVEMDEDRQSRQQCPVFSLSSPRNEMSCCSCKSCVNNTTAEGHRTQRTEGSRFLSLSLFSARCLGVVNSGFLRPKILCHYSRPPERHLDSLTAHLDDEVVALIILYARGPRVSKSFGKKRFQTDGDSPTNLESDS